MLERRDESGGWLMVGLAVISLIAFAGLLYVRGGSAPPIALSAGPVATPAAIAAVVSPSPSAASATPSVGPSGAPSEVPSAEPSTEPSSAPASAEPSAAPSGDVEGATSSPTHRATATRAPRPTRTPRPTPTEGASATPGTSASESVAFHLPRSPQPAGVALSNGQGGCFGYPTEGVAANTTFTVNGTHLTAVSPSNQVLSGQLKSDGSFSLSGGNPVERWLGKFTVSGGSGSYFIQSHGCVESYTTVITFH